MRVSHPSMYQRMLAGDLYLAADPEIVPRLERASDLTAAYCATTAGPKELTRRDLPVDVLTVGNSAWVLRTLSDSSERGAGAVRG